MVLVQGDSYQRKGHADYGGQTEANLDNFSELFGPVHIQAENQCPQDSKHNEESPTKACKFLEDRRSEMPHHWVTVIPGPKEKDPILRVYAIAEKPTAG